MCNKWAQAEMHFGAHCFCGPVNVPVSACLPEAPTPHQTLSLFGKKQAPGSAVHAAHVDSSVVILIMAGL